MGGVVGDAAHSVPRMRTNLRDDVGIVPYNTILPP